MPEMDRFEFQKKVQEEFQLPVVMMSADDKESSMLKGLDAEAAFYIVKPVNYDELKNIWQHAVGPRKGKSVDRQDVGPLPVEESPVEKTPDDPVKEVNQIKRDPKKRASKRVIEDTGKKKSDAVSHKKTRFKWTSDRHSRFLEAITETGLERAVPKRILEHMNMAGLTKRNVASHLQRYRNSRKAEESNSDGSSTGKNVAERTLRWSPSLSSSAPPQVFPQLLNQQLVGSFQQPRCPGNIQIANDSSLSAAIFPNQQASSSNPIPQLGLGHGHGQFNSMNNQASWQQQPVGNTNALPEANGGVTNQHQTQVRSELVPNDMSNNNLTAFEGFGTIHGVQNMESFNNSHLPTNFDCNNNIAGSGLMGLSNGFNGNYGSITGNFNGNRNLASAENANSGYYDQGERSSVGFSSTGKNIIPQLFPNQQASSSDFIPQLEYGQFHSMNNQDYFQQQTLGNTNPLYLANGADITSYQTQRRSELLSNAMSNNNFTAIAGSSQMGFGDGEISNGFSGSYDLRNGDNGNMNLALVGNLNSGYHPQEAHSSAGFGSTNQFSPRFSNVIQQEYNPMLGNVSLPKFAENGPDKIYLNQLNNPFYNEKQQVGEEVQNHGYTIHPNPVQQNPPENLRSFNQQQGGGEFLDTGPYNGYSNVNPAWNQGVTDDIMGSIIGPGEY